MDIDAYLAKAELVLVKLLKEWRPKLMAQFGKAEYSLKGDKSVVTQFDLELEEEIKKVLAPIDSGVGFLGEEHGQEGSSETYWTIDPIDGTESFLRGQPVARNQLAFVSGGKIQYALCYRFPTDDMFIARLGKGTMKNGQKVSLGYRPPERCWIEINLKMLRDPVFYEKYKKITERMEAAYTHDYLLVAEGATDCMISGSIGGAWDYYPRALIFQEAGAKVGNIGSDKFDLSVNNLVAAHPKNFDFIQNVLSGKA